MGSRPLGLLVSPLSFYLTSYLAASEADAVSNSLFESSAEIFPMRLRHYGMATAAASQWAFNFTISKLTPYMVNGLPNGRLFFVFAAINVLNSAFGFSLPEVSLPFLRLDFDLLTMPFSCLLFPSI